MGTERSRKRFIGAGLDRWNAPKSGCCFHGDIDTGAELCAWCCADG